MNPNRFIGSDSERIEQAVAAAKDGVARIPKRIPDAAANRDWWLIDRAILLPADTTLVLEDCLIQLSDRARDNFIRSANCGLGIDPVAPLSNIHIRGEGRAVLRGAEHPRATGDGAKVLGERSYGTDAGKAGESQTGDWRNIGILLAKVEGFSIENLRIEQAHAWSISLEWCTRGRVADIEFRATEKRLIDGREVFTRNQDGLDLRQGCRDITIERITGHTGDDLIALTAIRGTTPAGSLETTMVAGTRATAADDIEDIVIRDIAGYSAGGHQIVRFLNTGGIRLRRITLENLTDTSPPEIRDRATVKIGDNNPVWGGVTPLGDTAELTIRRVYSRSHHAVLIGGSLVDSSIDDIHNEHPDTEKVTYESGREHTRNLKGNAIMGKYNPQPYQLDLNFYPHLVTEEIPGPKSKAMHARATQHYRGLSGQVKLFPVAFERGSGCMLEDLDGNQYIDFSSGIYVTTLGHCHPKISEAVAKYAHQLMNAHDFTSEIKTRLLEKMAATLPGDLKSFQLYDSGTTAVEAGLRTCRAATGKHEFVSCFMDFHGKSGHSIGLARMTKFSGPTREPGFHLVPRPDTYRPMWSRADGSLDTEAYLEFYDKYLTECTTGQVAAFVLEPIQGWGGSIMPPDDFFPKLRKFLDERNILLFADEVLTSMGRTGKILCLEHWNTLPDVVTLGKGFGNGFPVTAMAVRTPYADAVDKISASTSYGGNPMACAAALACFEVIEEEGLLEHAQELEVLFKKRMADWTAKYRMVGDCRAKGCLLGVELVKDKKTKEPFDQAGKLVYQKAFRKGLAWIPAGHILRMSPPIVMPNEVALKGMDLIEEALAETEKELLG